MIDRIDRRYLVYDLGCSPFDLRARLLPQFTLSDGGRTELYQLIIWNVAIPNDKEGESGLGTIHVLRGQ